MISILNERRITEEEQDLLDLKEKAPEKFDYDFQFKVNQLSSETKREVQYTTYTREEIAALLAASKAPPSSLSHNTYKSDPYPSGPYPQEWIDRQRQLIQEYFEYRNSEKSKRYTKERDEWENFLKTSESDVKTKNTTKCTASTRTSKRSGSPTKKL